MTVRSTLLLLAAWASQAGVANGIRAPTTDFAPDVLVSLAGLTDLTEAQAVPARLQVHNEKKWLLLMKEGVSEGRMHELHTKIPQLGFYSRHARVLEYVGTKAQLDGDLGRIHLRADVEHFVMDVEMAIVPEAPDLRASTPPASGTWGLTQIGAGHAHMRLSGQGIRAFVFDTGINDQHPDFGGRVIQEFDSTIADGGNTPHGGDTGACRELQVDTCSRDVHGHGTHVAGTIAGNGVGVAPGAYLHAMKVAGDRGSGQLSSVVRGFNHIFDPIQVPREGFASQTVIACLGLRARATSRILEAVISRAVSEKGIVVVVAAGNRAEDACSYTPANVGTAIAVAAVSEDLAIPAFSNHGSCVDLFAPGVGVETLAFPRPGRFTHMRATGTSMAAPHVAGALALFLEEAPTLGPAGLRQLLLSRAKDNLLQGDLLSSPNKVLHLGDSLACSDTQGFRDAQGWSCASWRWNWLCGWSVGLPNLR